MKTSLRNRPVEMARRIEERNREIWSGQPTMLEDVTHVLGGIGFGLLIHPILKGKVKPVGWALVLLSTAVHFYADASKRR